MRWLILTLFLTACAQDKVGHFTAGAVTSGIVTEMTGDPVKGCLAALCIGILKETYDCSSHDSDPWDILATASGGCLIYWEF